MKTAIRCLLLLALTPVMGMGLWCGLAYAAFRYGVDTALALFKWLGEVR